MTKGLKDNLDTIRIRLDFLKETYNVKTVGVFGSLARGEASKNSDIDIIVEFSEPIGFFKFIQLENYLSGVLRKKVDLVTKSALKPVIRKNALKEAVYA